MRPLLINRKTALALALTAFVLVILGSLLKMNQTEIASFLHSNVVLGIGLALHFTAFFVVLYDLIVNPVRNKIMWLIGIFIFSSVTVIFYLITRDNHLERSFNPDFQERN